MGYKILVSWQGKLDTSGHTVPQILGGILEAVQNELKCHVSVDGNLSGIFDEIAVS